MRYKIIIILSCICLILIGGCSSEKDRIIDNFKSEDNGTYNIVIFDNKVTFIEFQRKVNNDIIDKNKLWKEIHSLSYIFLNDQTQQDFDYQKALEIKKFPEFFIFDNKGIVLRTHKIEELENFFLRTKGQKIQNL